MGNASYPPQVFTIFASTLTGTGKISGSMPSLIACTSQSLTFSACIS